MASGSSARPSLPFVVPCVRSMSAPRTASSPSSPGRYASPISAVPAYLSGSASESSRSAAMCRSAFSVTRLYVLVPAEVMPFSSPRCRSNVPISSHHRCPLSTRPTAASYRGYHAESGSPAVTGIAIAGVRAPASESGRSPESARSPGRSNAGGSTTAPHEAGGAKNAAVISRRSSASPARTAALRRFHSATRSSASRTRSRSP